MNLNQNSEILRLTESQAHVFSLCEDDEPGMVRVNITAADHSVNTGFKLDAESAIRLAHAILRGAEFVNKHKQAEEV